MIIAKASGGSPIALTPRQAGVFRYQRAGSDQSAWQRLDVHHSLNHGITVSSSDCPAFEPMHRIQ